MITFLSAIIWKISPYNGIRMPNHSLHTCTSLHRYRDGLSIAISLRGEIFRILQRERERERELFLSHMSYLSKWPSVICLLRQLVKNGKRRTVWKNVDVVFILLPSEHPLVIYSIFSSSCCVSPSRECECELLIVTTMKTVLEWTPTPVDVRKSNERRQWRDDWQWARERPTSKSAHEKISQTTLDDILQTRFICLILGSQYVGWN